MGADMEINWKRFVPTSVAIVLALLPAPAGLPPHAWFYFAIFAYLLIAPLILAGR
jgi:L-tartrate/succinate antiporter